MKNGRRARLENRTRRPHFLPAADGRLPSTLLFDVFEEVAELGLLGAEVVHGGVGRLDFEGDALDDAQPRLLHRAQLERVVRHQPDLAQPEVEEHLGALPVLAQVDGESQTLVGLDGVGALVLEGVGADLVDDADAAPLLQLVDDGAPTLALDELHGAVELAAAVALRRAEDVARQALRVDARERRLLQPHLALEEDDELLLARLRAVAGDAELADLGRQTRLRNPLDAQRLLRPGAVQCRFFFQNGNSFAEDYRSAARARQDGAAPERAASAAAPDHQRQVFAQRRGVGR